MITTLLIIRDKMVEDMAVVRTAKPIRSTMSKGMTKWTRNTNKKTKTRAMMMMMRRRASMTMATTATEGKAKRTTHTASLYEWHRLCIENNLSETTREREVKGKGQDIYRRSQEAACRDSSF